MTLYLDLSDGLRVEPGNPKSLRKQVDFNAVVISDVHLFTRGCLAHDVRNFLKAVRLKKRLALDGDMPDFILKNKITAPELLRFILKHRNHPQFKLVKTILGMPESGIPVDLCLGNHEKRDVSHLVGEASADNGITIHDSMIHETVSGRRCLILHGDIYDARVLFHPFLEKLGTHANELLAGVTLSYDRCRQNPVVQSLIEKLRIALPFSLSAYIKSRVDGMVYNKLFLDSALEDAFRLNKEIFTQHKKEGTLVEARYITDVICGHTHVPMKIEAPSPRDPEGFLMGPPTVTVYNTGCWVGPPNCKPGNDAWRDVCYPPPCTAVVELPSGDLDLVLWHPTRGIASYVQPAKPQPFIWPN